MTSEGEDICSSTHIPHSDTRITTTCDKDVKRWVQTFVRRLSFPDSRQGVDSREMAMIMPNDLVGLEIPTFDHLILSVNYL